jgi:hypothetical protein
MAILERIEVNVNTGEITVVEFDSATLPPPPSLTIPTSSVSMRQARLALLQSGLLATVDAAVAAGTEAGKIEWEYAGEVVRGSPLVVSLAAGLNLTEADLDNLFTLAASL